MSLKLQIIFEERCIRVVGTSLKTPYLFQSVWVITLHSLSLGSRQAVRHKTLTLVCVGSNPAFPAMMQLSTRLLITRTMWKVQISSRWASQRCRNTTSHLFTPLPSVDGVHGESQISVLMYALTAVGKTAAVSLPYTGDPSGIWGKYAIMPHQLSWQSKRLLTVRSLVRVQDVAPKYYDSQMSWYTSFQTGCRRVRRDSAVVQ